MIITSRQQLWFCWHCFGVRDQSELNGSGLLSTMDISIKSLDMIMLLIDDDNLFGWMLGVEKITEKAAELLFSVSDNKKAPN